jgi:hypothetical protein
MLHEILGAVAKLHSTSEIKGVLPITVLHDIAKLTEYVKSIYLLDLPVLRHHFRILEKVFTLLKQQQTMGRMKQLLEQRSNAERLELCRQELNHALQMFKVNQLEFISVHIYIITGSSDWLDTFSTGANEKGCKAVS